MPLSTEAKTLVRAARRGERAPDADARERVRRNVLAAVGVSAAAATAAATATGTGAVTTGAAATTTTGAALGLGIGAKIGAALVVIGLVGGGAAIALRSFSADVVPTGAAVVMQAPTGTVHPGGAATTAAEVPAPPAPTIAVEPVNASHAPVDSPVAPTTSGRPAASAPPADDLQAENELIGEAQRALAAGDTAGALGALTEHSARFPRGSLATERRALRALTLCTMGKKAEGLREAAPVLAAAPDSPLAARISNTCR